MFFYFFKHDWSIHFNQGHFMIYFMFYPILITLMAFSVSNPVELFMNISTIIIYINIFLSFIFSLEHLLHKDHERGKWDLYYLMHTPLEILCVFKLWVHWIIYGMSLTCFMWIMNHLFNMTLIPHSFYIMICGTLYLNALGFIVCAFVLGLKQNIFLFYMLLYPMYIPYVIFSNTTILLGMIGGLSMCLFMISPIFTSYTLKKSFQ